MPLSPDRKVSPWYVEIAVEVPGELTGFRAVLTEGRIPSEAEEEALEEARDAHPNATVSVFLSRKINEDQYNAILKRFSEEKWDGWLGHKNLSLT